MAELLCLARFDYTFFVIFRQDFCYNILGTIDYVYSLAFEITLFSPLGEAVDEVN